jgi:hypothetical protein
MYNHIKIDSLEKITQSLDPDIIALCETKKGQLSKKTALPQYEVIESNLKAAKEGLLVAVRKGSFKCSFHHCICSASRPKSKTFN